MHYILYHQFCHFDDSDILYAIDLEVNNYVNCIFWCYLACKGCCHFLNEAQRKPRGERMVVCVFVC